MTASTAPAIAPATYRIDPARSTVRFVNKAMFFTVRGTFTVREGTIVVADDITRSTATATVDAASLDTANTRRDNDLRSKKYLGTDQRVTLTLAPESTPDGFRFTTSTRLDRYAFGVTGGKGLVARHVDVELEIVASRA
jgi:polyisoprenoid-binding protein YceI